MNPSKYRRIRLIATICAWCYFLYMAYMLLYPIPQIPKPARYVFDVIHFLAFVVLGVLVGVALRRLRLKPWFILLVVWGVGSEILQRYTGRFCEFQDMVQNVLGAGAGFYAAWLLRRFWFERPSKIEDAHD